MRHAFNFPLSARQALKNYVRHAIADVDPQSYSQEPIFVTALAKNLDGVVYDEGEGFIKIKSTIVDGIGPKCAESWSGADLAITATIMNDQQSVDKAILIQSKLGQISDMTPSEIKDLKKQIEKMRYLTRSPKVMEIVEDGDKRLVKMISGNKVYSNSPYSRYDLGDYFVRRILTTLDGDTRPHFVEGVKEHSLCQLHIYAITPMN